jgi:hypothetical protein
MHMFLYFGTRVVIVRIPFANGGGVAFPPPLSAWARTLPRAHGIDSSAEFREGWPRLRPLIRLALGVMVGLERVAAKPGSSNSIRVNLVCLILVF